jgi:gamma-glutamylcyclotransferase (GGCT)/AIG2-like uncharacterized protein YtfP
MTARRLFVYGSLRRGERHHEELEGATFLGAARTLARYRIVVVEGYPALAPGARSVAGELYVVSPELLVRLDLFEGLGYRRGPVALEDGALAEAYLLAPRADSG